MNIRINGEIADITLQDEKTVGDIALGIREWMSTKSHIVLTVNVDGKDYDAVDGDELDGIELADVSDVNFLSASLYELELNQLLSIHEYLQTLNELALRSVEAGSASKELVLAVAEFPALRSALSAFFPSTEEGGPLGKMISIAESCSSGKVAPATLASDIRAFIATLFPLVLGRLAEYREPILEIDRTLGTLELLQPALADVSAQFQTNKLSEALGTMYRLIELVSKLLRCLSIANTWFSESVDSQKLGEHVKDLNKILHELMLGFEQEDLVLMADILEYELQPIFVNLRQTISTGQSES